MPSRPDEERQELLSLAWMELARASRRRVLALLGTVPAALALAPFGERDRIDARQEAESERKRGRYSPDKEERKFLDLINAYRRKHGVRPLSLQEQLGAAAEYHSRDMAEKNYFSHKLKNGDSPAENIERFGYKNWDAVGENIAAGYETARQVMKAWKKSRDHARNMRSKHFTEIGIGRAFDGNSKYRWYWTTTFGDR